MTRGVESDLQPMQLGIPQGVIGMMVGNQSGFEVSIKTFRMRGVGIVRGSGKMKNA
jgi:hypothetical protein